MKVKQQVPTEDREATMERIQLSFEKYSQEQKFDLVERLWNNLLQNEDEIESPNWHEPILAKRRAELDSGQAKTLDWTDELKAEIKKEALCE